MVLVKSQDGPDRPLAFEQLRLSGGLGQRIGEAIAEVQADLEHSLRQAA